MSDFESTFVVDVGSSSVKAGFSGEDIPSCVFPSSIASARYPKTIESLEPVNSDSHNSNGDSNKSTQPIDRGIVKDWDQLEKLWQNTVTETGITATDLFTVMLTESEKYTNSDRLKWAEMLFEKFRVPSICFGNSSSCCVFASGRTTGLAVDCGAGLTSVVPVFEGLALKHASITVDYGGQDVTQNLKKILKEKKLDIDIGETKILKERLARVEVGNVTDIPPDKYTKFFLPDGEEVEVETIVFSKCTEQMFQRSTPYFIEKPHPASIPPSGLIDQVYESWSLCDDSIRKDLLKNIILAGGNSMISGLGDRLSKNIQTQVNTSLESNNHLFYAANVIPSQGHSEAGYTTQRKFAPWIGASIISSLPTFKELKISRQEWEEGADAALQTKCF
jgi:actin-related protein